MSHRRFLRSVVRLRRVGRRFCRAVFGSVRFSWSPPGWLVVLGRHSRGIALTLLLLGLAGVLGKQWLDWKEAHRARPRQLVTTREVTASVTAPGAPTLDLKTDQLSRTPLTVQFKTDAAPLALIAKAGQATAARLVPERAGKWTWTSARALTFTPEVAWPAGTEFVVRLNPDELAPNTTVAERELRFTTPALSAKIDTVEFYTDPTEPSLHQAVATVTFSQPVEQAEVARRIEVTAVGGSAIFGNGQTEVTRDAKNPNQYHLRSVRLRIPEQEDFVRFRVAPEVVAKAGGKALGQEVIGKVTVPTKATGFTITGIRSQIINNGEGEPQQFLFVESSSPAELKAVAKATQAWVLPPPKKKPGDDDEKAEWAIDDVKPEVLAKARRIALEPVEEDKAAAATTTFAFRLPPLPAGEIYVQVNKGIETPGGFVLAKTDMELVEVPGFTKEAKLLGKGAVLALNGERKLSVKSRGFEHLRYTLGRVPVGQLNHLVSQTSGNFESPYFRPMSFDWENIAHFHREVQTIAKKNDHEANYSAYDFAPALGRADAADPDESRGLYYLTVEGVRRRAADEAKEEGAVDPDWIALGPDGKDAKKDDDDESSAADSRFILITDLGLLVKRNADGTRDVFVQSFSGRGPASAVTVTALARNGEPLAQVATGEDGHASLPALDALKKEKKPVAILARKGNDVAFLPWAREDRSVELSRFEVDGTPASEATALDAFHFTERGIYRPGDDIKLGAVVRQRDWAGSLEGLPLEVAVYNAKEESAGVYEGNLPADGFIDFTLPTMETAPTGVWRIELRRPKTEKNEDDVDRHLGHILVRVEDFQPDRMKIIASLAPAVTTGWLPPEKLTAQVELQTLFGIAAADRRVTAKMRVAPGEANFDGWRDWRFHLPGNNNFERQEIEVGEAKSDGEGRTAFPLALDAYTAPLLRVSVDLEAFEPDGGRGVRGALSALVSRETRLIGWKAEGDLEYLPRDVESAVRLVSIGPDLKPVAAPGLHRALIETRHVSVLTKQENGSLAYVSRPQDRQVERVDVELPAGETTLALPTKQAGRFRYEWQDDAGTTLCVVSFNVVGPGESARNLERDSELELTLPSREWKAGEQIEASLRAPYTGAGLMTIEREKVLGWQWFKADSASSVQKIAVPPNIEGGAYLNVAYVRAMDSPEVFTSPLSVGVSPFRVSPERRKLSVTLDTPEIARPGQPLKIGYRSARPGRAIIWAVDEGIHRVTRYQSPNPLALFFRKRSLEVESWQLLDLLLPEFSLLKKSRAYGGDGDAPELQMGLNPFKRRHAAPIVFWSGIVESGPERREVTYEVPDYFAGRLNIMALGLTQDAIGVAETRTVVKGPFVLTPNTPFFVAPGDEFVASLTVANQLEGAAQTDKIAVAVEAIGALDVLDAPKDPLTIPVGKETTVRIRVRAGETLGNAELKFSATAGSEKVEMRSTMSIRPATPFITEVQSGWFRQPQLDLKVGRALYTEFAKRDAVASTTPLGLAHGLNAYLRQYPHGCSEQITSKAFPWLVLRDDADFGIEAGEAKSVVEDTLARLARRQRSDGGFGYWSSADGAPGFDYLTIYVAHFITEAKASGFQVPPSLLDGMLRRLKAMASERVRTRAEADLQAAAIYLLTRHEIVTTNYALNLRDTLDQIAKKDWPGDASGLWLAATWKLLKKDDEASRMIGAYRKATAGKLWTGGGYYYESALTRAAQAFTVICRHFPEIAGSFTYDDLKPITEPISRGEFHTLSAAWSVLALKSYAALAKDSGLKVSFAELTGGKLKNLVTPASGVVQSRFATEATGLQFLLTRPAGSPDLGAWYQTIEAGFGRAVPSQPDTKGLDVLREFLDAAGQPTTKAKVGETLKMRLRLRNVNGQAQSHLAVTDIFPGGFDLAPDGLKPGLGTLAGTEYVDVREDRALLFTGLGAGESRTFEYPVRPSCAGTFVVPPAFAENMYDRAIHGTGAASRFTVIPRE